MKVLTGAFIFVAGAVTGAVGSLLYLRGEFKKKVEEEVATRDMAIRELKRRSEESEIKAKVAQNRIDSKVAEGVSKALGYSEDNVSALVRNAPRTHSKASQRKTDIKKGVVYSIDENGEAESYPTEGNADIPYGISVDDFLLTKKEYDKTSLTFYKKDGTLSTEDGDVVEDINYILGADWEQYIGKYEDGIAYIRNENAGTDYEVICEDRKYTDDYAL